MEYFLRVSTSTLGDERGFIHKRILRGFKGAVGGILGGPGGVIGGAARGFLGGTPRGVIPGSAECPPGFVSVAGRCLPTSLPSVLSDPLAVLSPAGRVNGATSGPCPTGYRYEPLGITGQQGRPCVKAGFASIAATGPAPGELGAFGEARMGRFGAGLEPSVRESSTRTCPRGAVLAVDGLCYNRRDLRNSERAWPRGRRPLLTGGDMRCISIASSAAKKLQKKQKQLTELGLLKRPASGSTALIKAKAELEAIKSAHYAGGS